MRGVEKVKSEKRFHGIPVAHGIARFPALVHLAEEEEILPEAIATENLAGEIARFEAALIATRIELLEIQQKIASAIGAHDASIFDAHLLVVEDRTLIDEVLRSLERDHLCIEYIFQEVARKYCKTLEAIDDPYLRERVVDIEDVARRVIRHLLGKAPHNPAAHAQSHIIVAHNLTPSDTAQLDRKLVHDAVADLDGVGSLSEGEDHDRREVIVPA